MTTDDKIKAYVKDKITQDLKGGYKKLFISPYRVSVDLNINVAVAFTSMLSIDYLRRQNSAHSFDSFVIDYEKFIVQ